MKTTVESIVSGKDLMQVKSAIKTWHDLNTSTAYEYRLKLYHVGTALNTMYDKGMAKGLKKPVITDCIREHFKGLNRFERSELRRLAHNAYDIECFAIAYKCNSTNANRLLQQWKNQVVENIKNAKVKVLKAKGIEVDKDTGEPKTVVNKTQNRVIGTANTKEGIEPAAITPGKQVNTEEFCAQFHLIHNGFIRRFNDDEFNVEQLNENERIMTNSLNHMNKTSIINKVFEASDKKKVA